MDKIIFYAKVKDVCKRVMDSDEISTVDKEALIGLVNEFFIKPIQWEYNYSSIEIWQKLKPALDKCGLEVTDIVSQSMIDNFFMELIKIGEIEMFDTISKDMPRINSKVIQESYRLKSQLNNTINLVKEYLETSVKAENLRPVTTPGATYSYAADFYWCSTPVGDLGIHILKADANVKVSIAFGKGERPAKLDITDQVKKWCRTI